MSGPSFAADIASRIQQIQSQFSPAQPSASPLAASAFADQLRAASNASFTPTDLSSSALADQLSAQLASLSPSSLTTTDQAPGQAVVADARTYLGIPYLWGGTDPTKGLDCSGLVQLVYKDLGYSLPRVAADQARQGSPVKSLDQAKPGDLLAYGSPVHHITIYIGNGKQIEAPHTGANVRVSDVYEKPSAIRRIIPDTAPASSSSPSDLALLLQRVQAGLPLDATQLATLQADLRSR